MLGNWIDLLRDRRDSRAAALRAMDLALAGAEQRFGTAALLANHPYFGGLTAAQWRKFHWRHTRHHLKQIRARLSRAT